MFGFDQQREALLEAQLAARAILLLLLPGGDHRAQTWMRYSHLAPNAGAELIGVLDTITPTRRGNDMATEK